MPLPTPRRVAAHGGGSARARIGALLFGLAFLLGAAEARAAAVCSNTPGANDWIRCTQTGTADIDLDLANPAISTTGPADEGIEASHTGTGNIDVDVTGGSIAAADANGVDARHEAAGAIDIDMTNVDVSTQGQLDYGVYAQHRGTSGTGIEIDVTGGSVTTAGSSAYGISANVNDATGTAVGAAISIDTKNTRVSTMGLRSYGVFGWINTVASTAPVSVNVAGGSVTTAGENSHAVRAYTFSQTGTGAITVGVTDGAAISTMGEISHGVLITQNGLAGIDADLTDAVISTANTSSYGFMGWLRNTSGSQLLDIDILRGSVKTTGARSYGILGYVDRAASASALSIDADGVAVSTTGYRSYGFFALHLGTGSLDVDLEDVAISTTGDESYGVVGNIRNAASTAAIAIDAAGDRAITVEGLNTAGILGLQAGLGSVGVTTGTGTSIVAPFAAGMEARATNDAGAAGRVVVTHGGAAEAREVGVLAWAARSSGHTMGAGATTADDAARTTPMIHVTSNGDVTVGAPVTDAFIRDRIAGADETLSAAEQAVLDAVTAEDSDALDTALAALPAAYDADWKAEARNLLRKRIAEPDAAKAANRAAEEILGLSRAGVRAVALSHTGMATFIRQGDRDPAILAIAEASRTEQQQAALAEQEKLSAAERTVLEATLTGSGLETALAALPGAAYTDDWKDGVRQRAASYNAGDVQVDVTGGAIDAEGNGVEALYAVPHDRNGDITVSVAEGARVTGGANGIYVRGGGAGTGSFRAQSVTVNGRVMGGTGAGVHLAGGGLLTVGARGAVGATSGVGFLADGGGDSSVTVAGAVEGDVRAEGGSDLSATVSGTVDGDVRSAGGGALTLNVRQGGVVTGTVHDPAGPLTVAGSIGRLLYTNGGAVTVAATGALTGIEVGGGTEAVRSEAGDLDLTVAGRVTGDVRARGAGDLDATISGTLTGDLIEEGAGDLSATVSGTVDGDVRSTGGGALTLNVWQGGVVTGTVHDPAGPLTVAGRIGRLLYTNGGAVTVAATGALTGIEVGGGTEAVRSEAGDLDLTVAGRVTGDVRARGAGGLDATISGTLTGDLIEEGGGDLSATVSGTVDGDVRSTGGGALTLNVRQGGVVAGTVHDPAGPLTVAGSIGRLLYTNGGAVTVAATGALTGIEVGGGTEALRSEAGDLDLTVAGMGTVTGDVRARGAGDLDATISGTLTGDVLGLGAGEHTVTVSAGGTVTGTVHLAASTVTVAGTAGRVRFDNGGTVTVAATGVLTGIEAGGGTEAVRSEAGDLDLAVAGRVTGDVRARGAGDLDATISGTLTGDVLGLGAGEHTVTVSAGGTVTGTVHLAASTVTVAGTAGRVRFDNGGAVTVAATGVLTGIEVGGGTEAVRSEAGDLDLAVAGRVTGDVRALGAGDLDATISGTLTGDVLGLGAGEHTVTVSAGGTVTGTVHLAASTVTVAGTAGRVRFDNSGTVTVAATGALTGIEVGGGTEAVRSEAGDLDLAVAGRVTGDVRALGAGDLDATISGTLTGDLIEEGAGNLSATVSGTVDGDVRSTGGGALTLNVRQGGVVTGTVHDPAGPLTVAGSIGRLLYTNGGAVTVAATGVLTGIEAGGGTEAVRSEAGDLDLAVAGRVTGDVRALGAGDLDATISGTLTGDLTEEGAGDLSATVSGTLTGDVLGLGTGEHTVTVSAGGTVTGAIHLAASTVTVAGTAGQVRFDDGGMVTVARTGRLTGIEGVAVRNAGGALRVRAAGRVEGDVDDVGERPAVVTVEAGGTVTGSIDLSAAGGEARVGGTVEGRIRFRRGGMVTVGRDGKVEGWVSSAEGELVAVVERKPEETTRAAAVGRAFPGGIDLPDDEILLRPELADHEPRMRAYEALPSVLLGLNRLSDFRERLAAPRSAHGGWARVEAFRGKWKEDESTTAGLEYDYRRHGLKAGVDAVVGEAGLLGVSFHHRQGSAEAPDGGEIDLSGNGVGVSGAWAGDTGVYVDVQAEATWYGADLRSASRVLKTGVSGRGHALGVEVGRRVEAGRVMLTPRARLAHSRVSVDDFTDAAGTRVFVEDGRSLRGRAGVVVETEPDGAAGNRVFGSVDVEHEFSDERKVVVSETELKSKAEATWLRLGLNGSHTWDDGRYTVQGGVSYATSGGSYELGGGLSLSVRF